MNMIEKLRRILGKIPSKYFYLTEQYIIQKKLLEDNCGQIWMLHSVSNDRESWYDERYCITANTFEKLLQFYISEGYDFRSLDFLEFSNEQSIFITFDDVFEDVFLEAFPILCKYHIPFCLFIATDLLNQEGYISVEELKAMKDKGDELLTIGSHTVKHSKLRTLKASESWYEMSESKRRLEALLAEEIEYFAYPYGNIAAVSKRERRNAKRVGYKRAFSTLQISLKKSLIQEGNFIPRLNINEEFGGRMLESRGKLAEIGLVDSDV